MIFTLGACLQEQKKTDLPKLGEDMPSRVFVTTEAGAKAALEQAQMRYEGEVQLSDIGFCKVENQQECMIGSFYIPKLLDLLGKRYAILFFVNEKNIVLVDNSDFSYRLIRRIQRKNRNCEMTKEKFLYYYITEFIHRDLELLVQYEKRLMEMEERISEGHAVHFLSDFSPVRKELLTLRSYYDELMDLGRELETNENGFFAKKQTKYFGTVTDRADRLMSKTVHLLEYAGQVRDAYQGLCRCQAECQYAVFDCDIDHFLPPHTHHGMVWHEFPKYAGIAERVSRRDLCQRACCAAIDPLF